MSEDRKRKASAMTSPSSQGSSRRTRNKGAPSSKDVTEVIEVDEVSVEGATSASAMTTMVRSWQEETSTMQEDENDMSGAEEEEEEEEGEEGEEEEEEEEEATKQGQDENEGGEEQEEGGGEEETEVEVPAELVPLVNDVMQCATAVRKASCSSAAVRAMQLSNERRRVQELLDSVEPGLIDGFINTLAALHDTDDNFKDAVKQNVHSLIMVQTKLAINIPEPPAKPAAARFSSLCQMPGPNDVARRSPETRFSSAIQQAYQLVTSYRAHDEQEKEVRQYASSFDGRIKATIVDYEFRLKASRDEVNQAIQNVEGTEEAKKMVDESIEQALPPLPDRGQRTESEDEEEEDRRGGAMVPVIPGVNTVSARAIAHVLDFMNAHENEGLRQQRQQAVNEVKRAHELLNRKQSYHKLLMASETIVRQLTGYSKHKLRQRVKSFMAASETAKQTLLSSLKELMRIKAGILEVVIAHHEDTKVKAEALRHSAEEYSVTTRSTEQLQITITDAQNTIINSDKAIKGCMEENKKLWDDMLRVFMRASAEELWDAFEAAMRNSTVAETFNNLLQIYEPPFVRSKKQATDSINIEIRHSKAPSTPSSVARSEREEEGDQTRSSIIRGAKELPPSGGPASPITTPTGMEEEGEEEEEEEEHPPMEVVSTEVEYVEEREEVIKTGGEEEAGEESEPTPPAAVVAPSSTTATGGGEEEVPQAVGETGEEEEGKTGGGEEEAQEYNKYQKPSAELCALM